MPNQELAHSLLRVALGLNILMHAVVRLPNLGGFADGLEAGFSDTFLPSSLVRLSAYGIVAAEAFVGTFLTLGLFTRAALASGALLMIVLIVGTSLRQDWDVLGTQMIYVGLYYFLLRDLANDALSVDSWRRRRRSVGA